jgi:NADPH:quinone reductase-like Zn-dependent oxidoreductase
MITRHYSRYEPIIKTLLRTQTTKLRIKSERRRFYHELIYDVHGSPRSSIKYYQSTDPHHHQTCPPNTILAHDCWVQVEMIAAPYNPADALGIQGKYPNPYTRSHNHYNIGNNNSSSNNNNNNNNVTNPFEEVAKWSRSRRKLMNDDQTEIVGTVPGSEGWGRIINVQRQTSSNSNTDPRMPNQDTLQIGDYVVMGQPGLGTYRSSLWLPSTSLVKLQRGPELFEKYGPTTPAPLFQTAGTALRMLRDYISPLPTAISSSTYDSVPPTISIVQNAGNSAVGLMVSQIATKIMNYQCISIIRSNQRTATEMDELQQHMMEYGNPTRILTQESLDLNVDEPTTDHGIRNIRLGLNAVGGDSIRTLLQMMISKDSNRNGHSATLVTYGNMSKQPHFSIDPSQLIFQNLNVTGFWYSQWMVQQQYQYYLRTMMMTTTNSANNSNSNNNTITSQTPPPQDARSLMMNEIVDAVLNASLKCPPVRAYPLGNFQTALEQQSKPRHHEISHKIVLDCRECE